jgi:AAA+ ATPase superfamily predicted ATPase
MAIDVARVDEFLNQSQIRRDVGQVVRGAGFEINWVLERELNRWGVYLKPNRPLQELFGTAREILLWVSEYPTLQARTVEQAQAEIDENQPRLSNEFCIVVSTDLEAQEKVREVASNLVTEHIGLPLSDLRRCHPIGNNSFVGLIQNQLFARDLYRVSTALTRPRGFYGRQAILAEVVNLLRTGRSNVGVFGLRKMGKTSLLYRILEALREKGHSFVAHIDVQRLDAINPTLAYALWSIGEALADSNAAIRRFKDLRLFGKYATFAEVGDALTIPELFDHDLRLLLSRSNRQIILLLDEIELMCTLTPGSAWGNAFVTFWRLLRGLHQQFPGRFAYLITGTNPKCTEVNKLGEQENPAYNYFDVRYLPALTLTDSTQLLRQIGRPMGLVWNDDAIRTAFDMVGGHPFLLRALASTVHRSLLPRPRVVHVTRDDLVSQTERFLSEFNANLTQMIEVLNDHYPQEFQLLEVLSAGRLGEFREWAITLPQEMAHLRGYGLLSQDSLHPSISVSMLQTWLQRRARGAAASQQHNVTADFQPGESIENYKVISQIGHRGGFAHVYRARRIDTPPTDQDVAIKVFKSGLLSNLQREMDALQTVAHPNIVSFLEHGKTETGKLYLVMEYLDGVSLRSKCDRANRFTPTETLNVMRTLADALVTLHPNEQLVEQLRRKDILTPGELQDLGQARHGYIHRDIKPENIILVPKRGPVLIDFNISSEVGTPITTLQRTPGYLPPDGLPASWSPEIDLYAFGVTMLQAAVGVEFDGNNLGDIREMAAQELPPSLCGVLAKLAAETAAERFHTARDLAKILDGVRLS